MNPRFPTDSDGEALRRVAAGGADMAKPMVIDFFVAVRDAEVGRRVAWVADAGGFQTAVERDDETGRWTCRCTKRMIATYDGLVEVQAFLDEISRSLGGRVDGWGPAASP